MPTNLTFLGKRPRWVFSLSFSFKDSILTNHNFFCQHPTIWSVYLSFFCYWQKEPQCSRLFLPSQRCAIWYIYFFFFLFCTDSFTSVMPAGQTTGPPVLNLGQQNGTSYTWIVNITSGMWLIYIYCALRRVSTPLTTWCRSLLLPSTSWQYRVYRPIRLLPYRVRQ